MNTNIVTADNELGILNGYFPDKQTFIDCIDEIYSIEDNYGRTTHLDEQTPFEDQSENWYKKFKKKKRNSNKFDFQKARSKIQILDDIFEGEQLSQLQLFGLATNLYWISGGFKRLKTQMQKWNESGNTDYSGHNFNTLKYLRKKNKNLKGGYFEPMPLAQYSPHTNDHKYKNVATSITIPRGYVRQLNKPDLMTVSEAEEKFEEEFEGFLNEDSNHIYLFKCPTALGKTRRLLSLKGVTIALPTHALKREVSEDMEVEHICSPETPEFINEEYNKKIELYHKSGLSTQKFRFLSELKHHANNKVDKKKAAKFIHQHNKTKNTSKTVLTTHPRGVHNEYDHKTLVFDEDPIQHMLPIKSIGISNLHKLLSLNFCEEMYGLVDDFYLKISKMKEGSIEEGLGIDLSSSDLEKEVLRNKLPFNIFDLLRAEYVYKGDKKFSYSLHNRLPDKKIAIMSATVNPKIYRKLYGNRVKVVDLSNTEIEGDIYQNTRKSYSKSNLDGSVEEVNNKLNGKPSITHLPYKEDIVGADHEMHFGNTRGYNKFEGEDINVVGTPHKPNPVTLLRAKVLGIQFDESEIEFSYDLTRYNGFEFRFYSYKNPQLERLQLDSIKSELLQAIGRARALRKNATVNVYSNLPIPQAKFIYN